MIELTLQDNETIAFISDLHVDSRMPDSRIDNILDTLSMKLHNILESCIANHVKYVFFEGDVINRVQCPFEPITLLGKHLMEFKANGIRCFTILGNHDIVRNSLDHIDKSPIQLLFELGALEHINISNKVVINNKVLITPVDYTEQIVAADDSYQYNILLAHVFYNQTGLLANDSHNVTKEVMEALGYDFALLGHDHEEYKDDTCGKTTVIRHGSVLRGTSHNYNFTRVPKFVIMAFSDKGITYKKVDIKHAAYKDVVSEYVINKKEFNSISGMQEVLSNLAEQLTSSEDLGTDRIYSIIMSDESLSPSARELLLKYINEYK